MVRSTETIVIGGGQAGLSLSFQLSRLGRAHVVLERGRVGDQWLARWDSLRLLTPNWLNRLDGGGEHEDVDGFLTARAFAAYLRRYARLFGAPVRERVGVRRVRSSRRGFVVETDAGAWRGENVVVATGQAAEPRLPALAASAPAWLNHMHSSEYRNAGSLPPGGVLVIGAGPSGQQIAAELRRAGRKVVLAVGRHTRSMRRYRGRDIWHWLDVIGELHRTVDDLERGLTARIRPLVLSGANGGEQLDLAMLDGLGVIVAGRLDTFDRSVAQFADDLPSSVAEAELELGAQLDRIDEHIAATYPEWPHDGERLAGIRVGRGPASLDLRAAGISTVIWATGYRRDYGWLDVPVLDGNAEIVQRHGISRVPGLYTLGLNFQRYKASHFIGGVGADAALLARDIVDLRAPGRSALRPATVMPAW